ncbi:MAG: bifunctional diaminohydroxyphosphoribosylaminopyrimidine deaminase/5-amino-6-(5-phosphoribosylamino)uracil reductase RibD [Myxococcaceae bacterium]|nr:bifunctional diaminohydroxyphosphoribosylaminopyrimidine deaminase/5-amino-6-(5-phosphoribosylamino)uracil reductase RibD [Myxococcaceae bacterium]
MAKAVAHAAKGVGRTHPNPAVGAVVVLNGKVVGKGFHHRAGAAHAEVLALAQAGAKARGAELYTTLEPCNHHGKTPPCTDAILAAGIKRVVFASSDPNPLVNGKGLARLTRAGVQVVPHVLKAQADALNRPFFKFMRDGLPWVTLKAAVTLDGKLATKTGDSKWVSGEISRRHVHGLRNQVDAIIVGAGTVRLDDPQLTTRLTKGGRDAARVVLDALLSTSVKAKLVTQYSSAPTVFAATDDAPRAKEQALLQVGAQVWRLGKGRHVGLKRLLKQMAVEHGWLHVLVEGGADVHGQFLSQGLVDEVLLYVAPKLVGAEGLTWSGHLQVKKMADAMPLQVQGVERLGDDVLLRAMRT